MIQMVNTINKRLNCLQVEITKIKLQQLDKNCSIVISVITTSLIVQILAVSACRSRDNQQILQNSILEIFSSVQLMNYFFQVVVIVPLCFSASHNANSFCHFKCSLITKSELVHALKDFFVNNLEKQNMKHYTERYLFYSFFKTHCGPSVMICLECLTNLNDGILQETIGCQQVLTTNVSDTDFDNPEQVKEKNVFLKCN